MSAGSPRTLPTSASTVTTSPATGPGCSTPRACGGCRAKTQVVQPEQRRLRAQPAHPLARGGPDRPRVRGGPGLQRRRRRHGLPRARHRPPALRPQRRDRARRGRGRHRRLRGQRPDAAAAHPARGQALAPRRPTSRPQPHPGQPRRRDEVPVATRPRAAPDGEVRRVRRRRRRSSRGSARAPPRAGGPSRPR